MKPALSMRKWEDCAQDSDNRKVSVVNMNSYWSSNKKIGKG
jgi:hypothetical protein